MESTTTAPSKANYAIAVLRIALGLVFLWAFLDKLIGLDLSTAKANSWMEGGHPTMGYLSSSYGPFGDMFQDMAGKPIVDALFMIGLGGVGLSLVTGVASRLGAWCGFAMVLLMYLSHPGFMDAPTATNHRSHPFLDQHTTEMFAMAVLAFTHSGDTWGLGRWWRSKVSNKWLQ